MSFNGNEGANITLVEGAAWTAAYRASPAFNGIKAIFYGKSKINSILKQAGCVGIRVYNAIDAAGVPVMVLVGTDANENDITAGLILERGVPCPPNCNGGGVTNPLQG